MLAFNNTPHCFVQTMESYTFDEAWALSFLSFKSLKVWVETVFIFQTGSEILNPEVYPFLVDEFLFDRSHDFDIW